jgi:DNA transposition AAA+ family ATPase
MRSGIYCSEVSNVKRFQKGVATLDGRGAEEASWLLVEGEPGLGKTRALQWYSVQKDAVLVRAKAGWTIPWMLKDICNGLDLQPRHSSTLMFDQIVNECVMRNPLVIVDEVEHAARKIKTLETLRDLTDISGVTLIAAGMKGIRQQLKAHKQVYNRIADVVEFTPATVGDVRMLCDQLSEVTIADDLVERIHAETGGINREILNSIARIEQAMRRNKGQTITAEMTSTLALTNDGRPRAASKTRAA